MSGATRGSGSKRVSERQHHQWWQSGTIYQIYPRSFQDSDGDGVGDLRGIRARLDYLEWLGIDAVWLSPIFRSPMADFGYDIADYEEVDPLFGTLADLDELIADLHRRGIRLLLDLVPNHTSDQHRWFVESRSSRAAARRDWYIWRDPRPDGSPPNGWQSMFGGSAWQFDEETGQYYFHSFLKEQPDLNWRNPLVREAIFDVMRFWFRRGVDGFRIDVVNLLAKRFELEPLPADQPLESPSAQGNSGVSFDERQRWAASPVIHSIMRQLRAVSDEFEDRVLVGEMWVPLRRLVRFYGRGLGGLHMPFNFQLITLPWKARAIHRAIVRYEGLLPDGAWPNWVLGNHDKDRIATRVGAGQARVAALLLLTLRGTPTLYYGDELGMTSVEVPRSQQKDPQGLRGGETRDPARTPMRWNGSHRAGFTTADEPWLPIGSGVAEVNVQAQQADDDSMLTLHRRLLALRRAEPALNVGDWRDLGATPSALGFERSAGGRRFIVAANLTGSPTAMPPGVAGHTGRVVASTLTSEEHDFHAHATLAPDEAILVRLE